MPFSYKTRTIKHKYITTKDATEGDRILITLEDGCVVVLKLPEITHRRQLRQLVIDKSATAPFVLAKLYDAAIREARREVRRRDRKLYTFETAAEQVELRVDIGFDDFYRKDRLTPGNALMVWALFPHIGGSPVYLSCIADVEFVST